MSKTINEQCAEVFITNVGNKSDYVKEMMRLRPNSSESRFVRTYDILKSYVLLAAKHKL